MNRAREARPTWVRQGLLLWMLAALGCAASAADTQVSSVAAGPAASDSMQSLAQQAFAARCARCHATENLTPLPHMLKKLTPGEVYAALRHGVMQEYAVGFDDGTLHALANLLGDPEAERNRPANGGAAFCAGKDDSVQPAGSWPGWSVDNTNTRRVDRPFATDAARNLRLRWAFVFPDTQAWNGAGNALALADGRVYVGNLNKWVYALDAATGCTHWAFQADGRVRSNVAVANGVAVFGDLLANVYGLDAQTGKLLWRQRAEIQSTARISGSVTLHDGRAYVPISALQEGLGMRPDLSCCTFNGSVAAFDLKTGTRLWQTYLIQEPLRYLGKNTKGANRYGPSGVPVFVAPTVDSARGLLYVATGNQLTEPLVPESDAVIALDLATGAKRWVATLAPEQFGGKDIYHIGCEAWVDPTREACSPENPKGQGDRDFAAPAMLVKGADGKDVVVAGSKDGMLYALDPDAGGALVWKLRVGRGGELGGIEYGLASDGKFVYAPVVDWSVGEEPDGALNAVDLSTGRLAWRMPTPRDGCTDKGAACNNGVASPATVVGDVVFSGGLDGVLRAHDRRDGTIVWSYDAVRTYQGVNGIEGRGGSFGMGGVAMAGDMLFVTSGLQLYNIALGGNVLLAFDTAATDTAAAAPAASASQH